MLRERSLQTREIRSSTKGHDVPAVMRNLPPRRCRSLRSVENRRTKVPLPEIRCAVCTWLLWLLLAGQTLSVAASTCPTDALSFRAAACGLTSLPFHPSSDDWFFTGLAGVSGELSLLRTRHVRRMFGFVRPSSFVSRRRECGHMPPRSALAPAFFPWRFFSPWKFAPSPSDDDPALN